jgi:ubiquinone/menaquinone biosynthesis C-methylase UbiE
MDLYHWGVYTTTFAWEHHLRLFEFFKQYFLKQLLQSDPGKLLDLGCGSGIWHLLALRTISDWQVTAIDISETSIALTKKMWQTFEQPRPNVIHEVADALQYTLATKANAAISCFLLEHLETPDRLLQNLANNIEQGAYAFVTCALTAAEIDHIYEFHHEAQVVSMAEESGFRVIATLSSSPKAVNSNSYYLPRSMALVLQKRQGDIW